MIPPEIKDANDWEEALAFVLQALDDVDLDVEDVRDVQFGRRNTGGIYWNLVISRKIGSGKMHWVPSQDEDTRRRQRALDVIRYWAKKRDEELHPMPLDVVTDPAD